MRGTCVLLFVLDVYCSAGTYSSSTSFSFFSVSFALFISLTVESLFPSLYTFTLITLESLLFVPLLLVSKKNYIYIK